MHPSRSLHVDSYEALTEAMADFHDERFDLDSMAFDPDQRCWSGRFYRRVYDDARTTREHSGVESPECFREYFPVVECTLKLYNVTACSVRDRARIVKYTFNECEPTDAGFTLSFNQNLDIDIDVDGSITGALNEHELDQRGYVLKAGWGAESGIRLEGIE